MLVQLDLNHNDRDTLLRHCQTFRPDTGDAREDARLADALDALEEAGAPCGRAGGGARKGEVIGPAATTAQCCPKQECPGRTTPYSSNRVTLFF